MYDAYYCGAGGAETERADLVVRGGKKTSVQTHGTVENKPVPTCDTYFSECMKECSARKLTVGLAS